MEAWDRLPYLRNRVPYLGVELRLRRDKPKNLHNYMLSPGARAIRG